jgi:hypothetical protein
MYREWTRDFRCCQMDCEDAIRHSKHGTLSEWYGKKTRSIKSQAQGMLAGVSDSDGLPDYDTHMAIPNDLATMERCDGSISDHVIMFMTPRIVDIVADVQGGKDWAKNWGVLKMLSQQNGRCPLSLYSDSLGRRWIRGADTQMETSLGQLERVEERLIQAIIARLRIEHKSWCQFLSPPPAAHQQLTSSSSSSPPAAQHHQQQLTTSTTSSQVQSSFVL